MIGREPTTFVPSDSRTAGTVVAPKTAFCTIRCGPGISSMRR